jgi:hypothetical protein
MRLPTGRLALLPTSASPSPALHRTWSDRPRHRARCTEQPRANQGAHGHWRDRRDSTRSSPPPLQAMHRPRPRTQRQEQYCVMQQNVSSISPRCHFYTRPPPTCLPTAAHGCYRIQRVSLHTYTDEFSSRSMLGPVLREEFADARRSTLFRPRKEWRPAVPPQWP